MPLLNINSSTALSYLELESQLVLCFLSLPRSRIPSQTIVQLVRAACSRPPPPCVWDTGVEIGAPLQAGEGGTDAEGRREASSPW